MNKFTNSLSELWISIRKFNFFDLQHSWLKFVLFITLLTITTTGVISYVLTQKLIGQMKDSARSIAQGYASILSVITTETIYNPTSERIFHQGVMIISRIPLPVVVTETDGKPRAWRNIGVDQNIYSSSEIDTMTMEQVRHSKLAEILKIYEEMDRIHSPIPIYVDLGDEKIIVAYLHHGNPPLFKNINLLPIIQTVLLLTLLVTLLFLIRITRSWEKDNIWMLIAKETAHQLATPMSSIMGWIELLKTDDESLDDALPSIEKDISRMNGIIQRFSKIGLPSTLIEIDLNEVSNKVFNYFSTRLPSLGKNVTLTLDQDKHCYVHGDSELLSWVVENMIKNSLDAIDIPEGRIEIITRNDSKNGKVFLKVKDNGKGMSKKIQKTIFNAGFTSKKYGWGMGLTLAKRIVEKIHKGEIFVESSTPGSGSTITIVLDAVK